MKNTENKITMTREDLESLCKVVFMAGRTFGDKDKFMPADGYMERRDEVFRKSFNFWAPVYVKED